MRLSSSRLGVGSRHGRDGFLALLPLTLPLWPVATGLKRRSHKRWSRAHKRNRISVAATQPAQLVAKIKVDIMIAADKPKTHKAVLMALEVHNTPRASPG